MFADLFKFTGYASRGRYWFVIIVLAFVAGLLMLPGLVGLALAAETGSTAAGFFGGFWLMAVFIAYCWVYLAALIRRVRDTGLNPWFSLLTFIPYLGWIAVIAFGIIDPDQFERKAPIDPSRYDTGPANEIDPNRYG